MTITCELKKFYGDDLVFLRNVLGGGEVADTFLNQVIEDVDFISKYSEIKGSRIKLKKLSNSLRKTASCIAEEPRLIKLLIYTDGFTEPEFLQPKHPFPYQDLPDLLNHYAAAADRALGGVLPKRGRAKYDNKFFILSRLVALYDFFYGEPPSYYRDSQFHELAVIILEKSGYSVSRENSNIENSLAEGIKFLDFE